MKGFDVYRTDTEEPVASYEHEVGKPYTMPVLFIHGGRAIVGGSGVGQVHVWDIALGKLQSLSIPSTYVTQVKPASTQSLSDDAPVRALSVRRHRDQQSSTLTSNGTGALPTSARERAVSLSHRNGTFHREESFFMHHMGGRRIR